MSDHIDLGDESGEGEEGEESVAEVEEVIPPPPPDDVQLIEDSFGFSHASLTEIIPTKRFTWITKNKMTLQLITYGATITCIQVPDRHGDIVDVVLGFEKVDHYVDNAKYYFGSTIGRVANVIRDSCYSVGSEIIELSQNSGSGHHSNGGNHGFDKVIWDWSVEGKNVTLSYLSPDGEEGYPGSLLTQITYEVTVDNTVKIKIRSTTTKPTPVNISNSIYFNLAGHHAGRCSLYNHIFTINADKYTPVTDEHVTTGEIMPVGGTLYDFRIPKMLSEVLTKIPGNAYDSNFCITKGSEQGLTFASRVLHPKSGRVLEVYSDQLGLQFSTANLLPDSDNIREGISQTEISPAIKGKDGARYKRHGGFCLQSQAFPNAMNEKRFPDILLNPSQEYCHNIVMKFGLFLGKYC